MSQTTIHPQGVGIGLRKPHYDALLNLEQGPPWLEFVPENFLTTAGYRSRYLSQLAEKYPLIPHGVALSVGGPDTLDRDYLRRLKLLADELHAPYVSDHLCFARALGLDFFDLLPLPFSEDAVHWVARRAQQVMDVLERPLLLENITYYAEMPGSELTEGEFVRAVLEESGAYLLLDVNNAYLNAINHGRSPEQSLLALPLERTRQIHMAGHSRDGDILLDSHDEAVTPEVLSLFELVIARLGPLPSLLEWDAKIPGFDRVEVERRRVESAYDKGLERHRQTG